MTMYQSQPRRKEWDTTEYSDRDVVHRDHYSIASIVFNDGTTHEFMVKASPSVTPHLVKEMKATGYLTLWNDSDTLCIRAEQIKHFSMREVTSK